MKGIKLWKVQANNNQSISIDEIENVSETESENQLEEVITQRPELLMKGLKLVGRQTETPGGPLDLLGVDADGQQCGAALEEPHELADELDAAGPRGFPAPCGRNPRKLLHRCAGASTLAPGVRASVHPLDERQVGISGRAARDRLQQQPAPGSRGRDRRNGEGQVQAQMDADQARCSGQNVERQPPAAHPAAQQRGAHEGDQQRERDHGQEHRRHPGDVLQRHGQARRQPYLHAHAGQAGDHGLGGRDRG